MSQHRGASAHHAPTAPNPALLPSRIALVCLAGTWHAEVLEPAAAVAAMVDLFGTATVPTPFLAATPYLEVVARLAALNPGAAIVHADLSRPSR